MALSSAAPYINRDSDKLELLTFQCNVGEGDLMTKPVIVNTLCWPRSEVVAIVGNSWESLSTEEKSSTRTQKCSREEQTFGKIYLESIEIS